jgi:hypothetical protein
MTRPSGIEVYDDPASDCTVVRNTETGEFRKISRLSIEMGKIVPVSCTPVLPMRDVKKPLEATDNASSQ